ncbi:Hcp family type VI secretion system effector [Dyella mobilis]|jgi:type VI secretion system secreted protein Hcp|uniref:Type VI secretion system tube protein Hcp n=1 Tax=Dyella mobilis TaxID=1849582 RepID=A0ABS2K9S4_9GAMM|nr:type VI secretion system tube protein Hcp [Dyella mobilis]MBM7127950.1 type VI secretion system tube protein Hcp [Dyella mobilis]GLQ99228.1 protein hcp1 [Dyella mobilis]
MAFDMHIKFGSGKVKIEGASNHKKHKGEVPILAWSWGTSNTGDLHAGAGSASGGKAHVQDISITKYVDGCSNALLQACCTGARIDQAWLYVTNATGEQSDFLTIELSEGILITSTSTGGSGGEDRLTENITLHFGKFKYSFQPQDDKGGKQGGTKDFTFDIQQVASA